MSAPHRCAETEPEPTGEPNPIPVRATQLDRNTSDGDRVSGRVGLHLRIGYHGAIDALGPIQRQLLRQAEPRVRDRGDEVARRRKVRLLEYSKRGVFAQVSGTALYTVHIELVDSSFACTCPYAASGELCKHVWATAIAADEWARADSPDRLPQELTLTQLTDTKPSQTVPQPPPLPWSAHQQANRQRQRWSRLLTPGPHPATSLLERTPAQLWFLLDLRARGGSRYDWRDELLVLYTARRSVLRNGRLGKPTHVGKPPEGRRPEGVEGLLWAMARQGAGGSAAIGTDLAAEALRDLCLAGRLGAVVELHSTEVTPLRWDADERFRVALRVEESDDKRWTVVSGYLQRQLDGAEQRFELNDIDGTLRLDFAVIAGRLIRIAEGHAAWVEELFVEPLRLTNVGFGELRDALDRTPGAPRVDGVAGDTGTTPHAAPVPTPQLRLELPVRSAKLVRGRLTFRYGDFEVGYTAYNPTSSGENVQRRLDHETACVARLQDLGVVVELAPPQGGLHPFAVKFDVRDFATVGPQLLAAGFRVEVDGKRYRRPSKWQPIVESGQDWFELKGNADFEGELVELPRLLRAVRNREQWIALKDGSLGLLPEAWLQQLATLAELTPPRAQQLRFHGVHASMIEGTLGASGLQADEGFATLKAAFQGFERIQAVREPKGFAGELRGYQRLALGWLRALDELGLGGCLADDMGLGKTVIVLAWLLSRRTSSRRARGNRKNLPSLLVVPKSLLFNWVRECHTFTPGLRLLLHHGAEREPPSVGFSDYDIVLTSYGTLRRDADALSQIDFDYVILDEAHSIKNAATEAHKAARSLSSRRRLALTGTPVENHLGELWTLLTFLNPDVMRGLNHLQKVFEGRRLAPSAIESGVLCSIRPFILRRTKAEVAKDLPERIEKTLRVQLSSAERQLYDELADFYRRKMHENRLMRKHLTQTAKSNAGRQMADALEGLLRLRQAACHPGLLDQTRVKERSAKFGVLLEMLRSLRAEGHKALVFSQFTKLLELLAPHLDEEGMSYAYLDGKTVDREAEVDRFSDDPSISVFLISLKAGGVGLNLVSADYVFLLDPWWNPATEAQAIDRAHRIGQQHSVIAYRLLSDNTVEDKVAALQTEKRDMALALFGNEKRFSTKFTREDLESLLG